MITRRNMDRGLVLMQLFHNDFKTFEKEVSKLSEKDKDEICWWWERCSSYLERHNSNPLDKFMN